jgi:hypothetical protein
MKKKLQKLVGAWSTAYPTASSPYWRSVPIGRIKSLLAGVFFSASVVGFAFDLLQLPLPPLWRGLFWPLVLGAAAVGTLVTRTRKVPILLFFLVVLIWIVGGLSGIGWYGEGWVVYPISLLSCDRRSRKQLRASRHGFLLPSMMCRNPDDATRDCLVIRHRSRYFQLRIEITDVFERAMPKADEVRLVGSRAQVHGLVLGHAGAMPFQSDMSENARDFPTQASQRNSVRMEHPAILLFNQATPIIVVKAAQFCRVGEEFLWKQHGLA